MTQPAEGDQAQPTDNKLTLPISWINGVEHTAVAVSDRGLRFGDGLFETIRVVHGELEFRDYHLQRLTSGLHRLNIDVSQKLLIERLRQCLLSAPRGELGEAVLRLTVTRGSGESGYRPDTIVQPTVICTLEPARELRSRPAKVMRCHTPISRNTALAGMKHLNRLDNVLAAAELAQSKCDEGILLAEDEVISGVMSNLFIMCSGTLWTPALEQAGVEGTMRRCVLEILAPALNVETVVRRITWSEVLAADEVFLTNSLIGIRPVGAIAGKSWTSFPLVERLSNYLQAERGKYSCV